MRTPALNYRQEPGGVGGASREGGVPLNIQAEIKSPALLGWLQILSGTLLTWG